jgi:hypothetical protein
MEIAWNIPLDLSNKFQPTITIVVKSYNPFTYVVTLKILESNKTRDVRRWDNVNAPDHVDIFYKYKNAKKHVKSHLGKLLNLDDIDNLCEYIDKNYERFISKYFER